MQQINEDEIKEIVIDFQELKSGILTESYFSSFGSMIKLMLDNVFGTSFTSMNVKLRGTKRETDAFLKTLGKEKKYIETARDYGLDNPRTYKSRAKLDGAVKSFEKVTGLKWPFK